MLGFEQSGEPAVGVHLDELRARGAGGGCTVVELVGPPGVGKTTLARALAAELGRCRMPVWLETSARPSEQQTGSTAHASRKVSMVPAGLSRAKKLLGTFRPLSSPDPVTASLLEVLPPRSSIMTIRMRRYLGNLARVRRRMAAGHVLLQDQGYVCAIATLALFARRTDCRSISEALDVVPLPSLVVRLDASPDVVEERLRRRLMRQGFFERLFELSPERCLGFIAVFSRLDALLADRGCPTIRIESHDYADPRMAANHIIPEVLSRCRRGPLVPQVTAPQKDFGS